MAERSVSRATAPLVTVILPVRNEGAFIERSLGSVLEQTWLARRGPQSVEILVVDGQSTDDTRERVRRLAAENAEIDLRLLDNPGRTAPCALNVGLRHARGEFIARVDGHAEIEPDYLETAMALLDATAEGERVDGVGGVLLTLGEGLVARAIAAAMSSRFGVGGSAFRVLEPGAPPRPSDTVAFPVYRRQAVARNGGFDEELLRDQDEEWNYRLRADGGRLLTSGGMVARYFSRSSFRKLAKQYFQYGLYKVRVLQLHPRQMSWRQFVPPLFVAALLASALLAASGSTPIVLVVVAGSYALANLLSSLWTAGRAGRALGPRLLPLLPLAFVLLHVGYGFGFLVGLVRWATRWGDGHGHVPDLGWDETRRDEATDA